MRWDQIFAGGVILAAAGSAALAFRPDVSLAVPGATAVRITTTPQPLDPGDPGRDRVGALRFLGALHLRSTNKGFGGISALRSGPGSSMLALTDTGNWLTFDTIERAGRLIGVGKAVMTPILDADGRPPTTKADGDAEALEWNPATGAATIVFEQDHRLLHFAGIDPARPASLSSRPVRTERLTAMTGWPANGGGEAVAVLAGGARIVISETARGRVRSRTALLTRDDTTTQIELPGVDGHAPTDAIALDATRLLVLHRRFTLLEGQGAALSVIDLDPVLAGTGPASARLLAQWEPPITLDNMEGLALRCADGRLFVYLISDDNLNSLQRTLLMKFELDLGALGRGGLA